MENCKIYKIKLCNLQPVAYQFADIIISYLVIVQKNQR